MTEWDATLLVRLSLISSARIGTRRRKPFAPFPSSSARRFLFFSRSAGIGAWTTKARLALFFFFGQVLMEERRRPLSGPPPYSKSKSFVRKTMSGSEIYCLPTVDGHVLFPDKVS